MIVPQEISESAPLLLEKAEADAIDKPLIGAVVYRNGQVLLVKRAASDSFAPGHWEFSGGGLEENPIDGLVRELTEETGLQIMEILAYLGSFDSISEKGQTVRQFNYLVEPKEGDIQLSDEHSEYMWHDLEALLSFIQSAQMLPVIRKAIQDAVVFIKTHSSPLANTTT